MHGGPDVILWETRLCCYWNVAAVMGVLLDSRVRRSLRRCHVESESLSANPARQHGRRRGRQSKSRTNTCNVSTAGRRIVSTVAPATMKVRKPDQPHPSPLGWARPQRTGQAPRAPLSANRLKGWLHTSAAASYTTRGGQTAWHTELRAIVTFHKGGKRGKESSKTGVFSIFLYSSIHVKHHTDAATRSE